MQHQVQPVRPQSDHSPPAQAVCVTTRRLHANRANFATVGNLSTSLIHASVASLPPWADTPTGCVKLRATFKLVYWHSGYRCSLTLRKKNCWKTCSERNTHYPRSFTESQNLFIYSNPNPVDNVLISHAGHDFSSANFAWFANMFVWPTETGMDHPT